MSDASNDAYFSAGGEIIVNMLPQWRELSGAGFVRTMSGAIGALTIAIAGEVGEQQAAEHLDSIRRGLLAPPTGADAAALDGIIATLVQERLMQSSPHETADMLRRLAQIADATGEMPGGAKH